MKLKCKKCGYKNTFNPASILGSMTSDKKAKAARENGKKGGRPIKDSDITKAIAMLNNASSEVKPKIFRAKLKAQQQED